MGWFQDVIDKNREAAARYQTRSAAVSESAGSVVEETGGVLGDLARRLGMRGFSPSTAVPRDAAPAAVEAAAVGAVTAQEAVSVVETLDPVTQRQVLGQAIQDRIASMAGRAADGVNQSLVKLLSATTPTEEIGGTIKSALVEVVVKGKAAAGAVTTPEAAQQVAEGVARNFDDVVAALRAAAK